MLAMKFDQAQAAFFDRDKVLRAVDKAGQRVLSRYGAFVRARAISLLLRHPVSKGFGVKSKVRNRQGVSRPGEPPFAHLGLIPKFVFFAWDQSRRSVVIGPVALNDHGGPEVLAALEWGGSSTIEDRGRRKRITVQARPFMAPAEAAERDNLPSLWANSVR